MSDLTIYTTRYCGFCLRAKALLESKGVTYREIPVDGDPQLRAQMAQRAGRRSVPQIWIGQHHVGGCQELHQLAANGELDRLLAGDR